MKTKKNSEVNVFAGSPWEIAIIINLLSAAYIRSSVKDEGVQSMSLFVPAEHYAAAMRIIDSREH